MPAALHGRHDGLYPDKLSKALAGCSGPAGMEHIVQQEYQVFADTFVHEAPFARNEKGKGVVNPCSYSATRQIRFRVLPSAATLVVSMSRFLTVFSCCIALDLIYRLSLWLSWSSRRFRAGGLVLDASRNQGLRKILSYSGLAVVLATAAFGTYLAGVHFSWPNSPYEQSHFAYQFVFLAWMLVTGMLRGKLELCEGGIMNAGSLIPWQEIRGWSWGTRLGGTSVLTISRTKALLKRSELHLHVPADKEEAVERIMQRRLPTWN